MSGPDMERRGRRLRESFTGFPPSSASVDTSECVSCHRFFFAEGFVTSFPGGPPGNVCKRCCLHGPEWTKEAA